MKTPHFAVPLSAQHLETIGRICVAWSELEFLIELGLFHYKTHTILSLPRDIKIKLTELQKSVEINVTSKAVRVSAIGLMDRVRIGADKRNLAVHGKWATDVNTREPVAVSWFGITQNDPLKQLYARELVALHDEICDLTHGFQAFLVSQNAFGSFAAVYGQKP